MQYVENDMDGLFQRSAEHYQLDAGASDWENISVKLSLHAATKTASNKSRSWLTMLGLGPALFLTMGVCCPKFISEVERSNFGIGYQKIIDQQTVFHSLPEIVRTGNDDELFYDFLKNKEEIIQKKGGPVTQNDSVSVESANQFRSKMQQRFIVYKGDMSAEEIQDETDLQNSINEHRKLLLHSRIVVNIETPKAEIKENTGRNILLDLKHPLRRITADRFYFGMFATLDGSKVKSMPFDKIGFGAGFMFGYNITKKFSAEASLAFQRKKYDSYGKDFSLNKVGSTMPSGMVIKSLQSNASVTEVNLKARYKILQQKRSSVYIAAGLSEYIITNESNTYNVSLNGNSETMRGKYEKNISKLPAVASFSAVYQHSLIKKISIRIEPYLKVPIQGIGIGNVPVTSAGIQIGITRSLH
ncbi:hypothetical protein BH11BAC4_BH11BAC4_16920 [soil metagenome]